VVIEIDEHEAVTGTVKTVRPAPVEQASYPTG
jgi:hypothetical protein